MVKQAISQFELIEFLTSANAFEGHIPERIDTALSHVFLAGPYAYKLKRAIKLDFVDYSTVEKRREFCQRELQANANWPSSLYIGIVPITFSDGVFTIDGSGKPVDWLVKMRRLDKNDRLDKALELGTVSRNDIFHFADDLAHQHQRAAPQFEFGGAKAIDEIVQQITRFLERTFLGNKDGEHLSVLLGSRAKTLSPLLDARFTEGCFRLCHGDLHLQNICRWDGRLTGFDALEFDDHLRTIDVLYDLAFPIMDLIQYGHLKQANQMLSRYLAQSDDYQSLAVLDLYLSLRASVRGLAAALAENLERAEQYISLAIEFLLRKPDPRLVVLGGRSGTGKTSQAELLAPHLGQLPGAIVLRSDVDRKIRLRHAPEERLQKDAYSTDLSAAIYATLYRQAERCIDAGYACIINASFLNKNERAHMSEHFASSNIHPNCLWLTAPADTLRQRLSERGSDASDATIDVIEQQLAMKDPEDWRRIDVSASLAQSADAILGAVEQMQISSFSSHTFNPAHDA